MKIIINLWRLQHLTQIIQNVWGRVGGGGLDGEGGGLERKWKREAEKGDNEGRETQIG